MKKSPSLMIESAKLFKNGQSQAVRLPKGYRFDDTEVFIKKVGDAVVLLPRKGYWEILFNSVEMFSDDFMPKRDKEAKARREELFK